MDGEMDGRREGGWMDDDWSMRRGWMEDGFTEAKAEEIITYDCYALYLLYFNFGSSICLF